MYTLSGDNQCTHFLGTLSVHTFWGHSMYTVSGDTQCTHFVETLDILKVITLSGKAMIIFLVIFI